MAASMKRIRDTLAPSYWKRFIFDPARSLPALLLLFIAEVAVSILVIFKIKCKLSFFVERNRSVSFTHIFLLFTLLRQTSALCILQLVCVGWLVGGGVEGEGMRALSVTLYFCRHGD